MVAMPLPASANSRAWTWSSMGCAFPNKFLSSPSIWETPATPNTRTNGRGFRRMTKGIGRGLQNPNRQLQQRESRIHVRPIVERSPVISNRTTIRPRQLYVSNQSGAEFHRASVPALRHFGALIFQRPHPVPRPSNHEEFSGYQWFSAELSSSAGGKGYGCAALQAIVPDIDPAGNEGDAYKQGQAMLQPPYPGDPARQSKPAHQLEIVCAGIVVRLNGVAGDRVFGPHPTPFMTSVCPSLGSQKYVTATIG